MISSRNVGADGVRTGGSGHKLFVEGGPDSIDPLILKAFFNDRIAVEPLGASFHVSSAAEALHKVHPTYYFLIDRDHHDDAAVEKSWRKFPDTSSSNILIWRRREIENYFLEPEYLEKCDYILSCSPAMLRKRIIEAAEKRIYLDAANMVVVGIREELKKNWIECPKTVTGFETKDKALKKLLAMSAFDSHTSKVAKSVDKSLIEDRFNTIVEELYGGKNSLSFGHGNWLERIRGKHILPEIIDKCFIVKDAKGTKLAGKDKLKEVVRNLLKKPLANQPDDFQELHRLVMARLSN